MKNCAMEEIKSNSKEVSLQSSSPVGFRHLGHLLPLRGLFHDALSKREFSSRPTRNKRVNETRKCSHHRHMSTYQILYLLQGSQPNIILKNLLKYS